MKPSMSNALATVVATVLLPACSSNPMKVALTEMGTSSQVETGDGMVRYMRTINLTGIAPEEAPGSITLDVDHMSFFDPIRYVFNKYFSPDLPDMMNTRMGLNKSILHVRSACDIDTTCLSQIEAANIKIQIEKREQIISQIASEEIDIKALQLVKLAIDSKKDDAEKEAILVAVKQKFIDNSEIQSATKDNYGTVLPKAENAFKTSVNKLKVELSSTLDAVNKPGIIVSNWKLEKEANASGYIPGSSALFGGSKDRYGYVIFINPVQITLEIGNDIGAILDDISKEGNIKAFAGDDRLYITLYQMRVSDLIYSESLESLMAAKMDVKVDELAKTLKPLVGAGIDLTALTNLKAQVAAEYKKYSFSSNQGILSFRSGSYKTFEFRDALRLSYDYDVNEISVDSKSNLLTPNNPHRYKIDVYTQMLSQTRAVINSRVNFNTYVSKLRPELKDKLKTGYVTPILDKSSPPTAK
ncbi:hypothetical protein Q9292_01090 [Methylophilus sp. VKM B-3414]|uniref:hypothetical protein n=1 Tax=Methylophilus sp. VKM B-3414 TaxID=3076121 RepID=UPI0028C89D3A|nr:hypothetical protein [Methylophilus sp. VKM B-3414]MDT7848187.1 hypothetical protein [Methylophilus sp. VKM B-3414]